MNSDVKGNQNTGESPGAELLESKVDDLGRIVLKSLFVVKEIIIIIISIILLVMAGCDLIESHLPHQSSPGAERPAGLYIDAVLILKAK